MRKVQFINSCGKLHEYNFIRVAVPNDEITVYSDTGYVKYATEEVSNYYKEHSIRVIKANDFSNIGFRPLRVVLNVISGIRIIIQSRKEHYDYCFIHFLSDRRAILSYFIPSSTKQILITYGSDILRRKNFNGFFFNRMLDRAHLIDFTSGNLRYNFEKVYQGKYRNKSVDIAFPCYSYGTLEQIMQSQSKESIKEHFRIPVDKKVVVCGHTSTENERYEKMIDALENISDTAKRDYHFVFFMTYGSGNYKKYRSFIEEKLKSSTLSYTVLNRFLSTEEVSMVHVMSDVHITSILTDAISFFMLEELYAGAILLYGEWLHYTEFEEDDFGVVAYKDFHDLTVKFNEISNGFSPTKPECIKQMIRQLTSNDEISKRWQAVLN